LGSLQLQSIRKAFGDHEVLKGIDLDVKDGEFVIFVGPSGCGKSTLLRVIAGLEDASSGSIRIDGSEMATTPPAKRGIAMVFQSYALYPHLTVKDNMGLGLKQAGTAKAEIEERVTKASTMLSLDPYLARRPAELSGGQRQRVAIGRAIVREPKLFLFDEPLSNLDAALRVQTRLEIASLHRRLKATMIYVTHDQVEAMTLADKIVVLNAGVIEQVGSPMDLYNKPANIFVAGFIGSPQMNFFPAEKVGPTIAAEGAKTIGIRPEHIALSRDAGDWKGKVVHAEHLGADTILYLETEVTGLLTVRLFGEHRYAADDVVFATPDKACLHRFDGSDRAIR
jgi:multiple sugar transport system ATP-binding protein